jgi:hypothetical protein
VAAMRQVADHPRLDESIRSRHALPAALQNNYRKLVLPDLTASWKYERRNLQ